MWPMRNGRSITAPGATVKRASANTPQKWKPRRRSHEHQEQKCVTQQRRQKYFLMILRTFASCLSTDEQMQQERQQHDDRHYRENEAGVRTVTGESVIATISTGISS